MKKGIHLIWILIIALTACRDTDPDLLFDKTADQRRAEAIAALQSELAAPANGWKLKYRPEDTSGAYNVLLKFNKDNTVYITTDLAANDGEFFQDTITYRVDSALGLELIMESYCFFSYLFEQNDATFFAEFEFLYVQKNDDGSLLFKSKTDPAGGETKPTELLFQKASAADAALVGQELSTNLAIMSSDFQSFTSPLQITFASKDLILYLSVDELTRTIEFKAGSRKSNTATTSQIGVSITYTIEGNKIVLDKTFERTLLGTSVSIQSIELNNINNSSFTVCADPITTHVSDGKTSNNEIIQMASTLADPSGAAIPQGVIYDAPISNIFHNRVNQYTQISADIPGASEMLIYYNYNGTNAMGFYIPNADGTGTIVIKDFTSTFVGNNIRFTFSSQFRYNAGAIIPPAAVLQKITDYLNLLNSGNNAYVLKYQDGLYEFHNPCNGWSFGFIAL